MYVVVFVFFPSLNLRRWIFFASVTWDFFNPINSLNHVRICASTPYNAPRDLQKQDRVIARFSCYTRKKSGHCTKFCVILLSHENRVICLRCRTGGSSTLLHFYSAGWCYWVNPGSRKTMTSDLYELHSAVLIFLQNWYFTV